MGSDVVKGWQTWEKLVFILLCALLVTILLGCAKLGYNHWRLRQYGALDRERQELVEQRFMSQQRRRTSRGPERSDEVPFGIRALESGLEIEGVWISRDSTSRPASKDDSGASSISDCRPARLCDVDLEKQNLHSDHIRSISESAAPTQAPVPPFYDGPINSHKLKQPDSVITKPVRSRRPPSSYRRYQANPYLLRQQSSATNTLQGLEAIHRASSYMPGPGEGSIGSSDSSNQSKDSAGDIAPISASAPDLLSEGQLRSKPRQMSSSSDLELLDSHRISQVAETGQLTPRGRTPGKVRSADFATHSPTSAERSDYFGQPKSMTLESDTSNSDRLPAKPKMVDLPPTVRSTSMPEAMSFAEFCRKAPPSPRLESRSSNDMDSVLAVSLNSTSPTTCGPSPTSPIMPASEGARALKLPPSPSLPSFEKQAYEVIRGHGSGFEVLRPGSLNPPMPGDETSKKPKIVPSISLGNASCLQNESSENPRKLQKKRRSSFDSLGSTKTNGQSRTSVLV